jgi:choline dehydrogenase-like flavoprotein
MRLSNLWIVLALAVDAAPTAPGPSHGCQETLRCEYDYIVVGAGASGLTVANRLSEQANTSVLVIEAGIFDAKEDFFTIPGLAGGAIGTKYDWNLTYAKSVSLNGREVSIPAGKLVGGSTQLNRMVFDRGSKSDYDRWSTLGNKGWDWESLLPYFKKVGVDT